LLDLLAAAERADNFTLFVVDEGQNLIEEFLAVMAEEFVVGHGDLSAEGMMEGILDLAGARYNWRLPDGTAGFPRSFRGL